MSEPGRRKASDATCSCEARGVHASQIHPTDGGISRLESLVRSALSSAPGVVSDEYGAEIQAAFVRLREQHAALRRAPIPGSQVEFKAGSPKQWGGPGLPTTPSREAAEERAREYDRPVSARWVGPWRPVEEFDEAEMHPESA